MPFYQWRCPVCHRETDVELAAPDEGRTCCGEAMRKVPQLFHHDAWGSPRYIRSLDRTFDSHAELKTYLEREGIQQAPSADKHHGARNEGHRLTGNVYDLGRYGRTREERRSGGLSG